MGSCKLAFISLNQMSSPIIVAIYIVKAQKLRQKFDGQCTRPFILKFLTDKQFARVGMATRD